MLMSVLENTGGAEITTKTRRFTVEFKRWMELGRTNGERQPTATAAAGELTGPQPAPLYRAPRDTLEARAISPTDNPRPRSPVGVPSLPASGAFNPGISLCQKSAMAFLPLPRRLF